MRMLDSSTFDGLSKRKYDFLGFPYAYTPIKLFTKEDFNSIFIISFIS